MMADGESSGGGGELSNGADSPNCKEKMVYKVVLTGGPCAGKTTALVRVSTFFEQIGWKVYMVPEAATILLGGGVQYPSLNRAQQKCLNESILKTIMRIEESFMELARLGDQKKCLVVCDRGVMDPSAFCTEKEWQDLMDKNGWNLVSLRDERYDQIVHMQSAAKGAEDFYQLTNNATRSEGLELAREMDTKAAQAWVGHPYCDVIDNSTDFENKLKRVIAVICKRLGKRVGIDVDERLKAESKKRKFLVKDVPRKEMFPKRFQDFDVQHDYLQSQDPTLQVRIRKRGQNDNFTYTYTERKFLSSEKVELFRKMTKREYMDILKQKDPTHCTINKLRRCFHWKGHYFQLDIYQEPAPERCKGLVFLETYTHLLDGSLQLPTFLSIEREITGDPDYSMYNLSQLNE